jgi:hypothetical protein
MKKARKDRAIAIAIGIVALVLYVTAYFDSVVADVGLHLERGSGGAEVKVSREPRYKFGQSFCQWFFYPIYQIDRRLVRPGFWAPLVPNPARPEAGWMHVKPQAKISRMMRPATSVRRKSRPA